MYTHKHMLFLYKIYILTLFIIHIITFIIKNYINVLLIVI